MDARIVKFCLFLALPWLQVSGTWQPSDGNRDDWLRCHGFSCDQWNRIRVKLEELRYLMILEDLEHLGTTDQIDEYEPRLDGSLDAHSWLTEEQVDILMATQGLLVVDLLGDVRHRRGLRHRRTLDAIDSGFVQPWPLEILWKFDGTHDEADKQHIRNAFTHWADRTCVRFTETPTDMPLEQQHLLITSEPSGCKSFIGQIEMIPQQLNLDMECLQELGDTVHMIGYVLGLLPEQQRTDRDEYVTIQWENVDSRYVGLFHKLTFEPDTPYDFSSIMHSGPLEGSRNGELTLLANDPLQQGAMGQRQEVSYLNARAVKQMYCSDLCMDDTERPCQSGGYQNPDNCAMCVCPDGLDLPFCETVAPARNAFCGGDYDMSANIEITITSPNYDSSGRYRDEQQCFWRFYSREGDSIMLTFVDDFGVYSNEAGECIHSVEVRTRLDMSLPGSRLCGDTLPEAVLRSEGSSMMVVFRSTAEAPTGANRRGFKAVIRKDIPPPVGGNPELIDVGEGTTPETGSGRPAWGCSFELASSPLCDMEQSTDDELDWTRFTGATPSQLTGPTGAQDGDFYIYIEATGKQLGDKAILRFPDFDYFGAICVRFHYHMYGFHVNQLQLVAMGSDPLVAWEQTGQKDEQWHLATVGVNLERGARLAFVASRGEEYSGDIAVDNVLVTFSACPTRKRRGHF